MRGKQISISVPVSNWLLPCVVLNSVMQMIRISFPLCSSVTPARTGERASRAIGFVSRQIENGPLIADAQRLVAVYPAVKLCSREE